MSIKAVYRLLRRLEDKIDGIEEIVRAGVVKEPRSFKEEIPEARPAEAGIVYGLRPVSLPLGDVPPVPRQGTSPTESPPKGKRSEGVSPQQKPRQGPIQPNDPVETRREGETTELSSRGSV